MQNQKKGMFYMYLYIYIFSGGNALYILFLPRCAEIPQADV